VTAASAKGQAGIRPPDIAEISTRCHSLAPGLLHACRGIAVVWALYLVAACSFMPYSPAVLDTQPFLARAVSQENGAVRVTAAVPDAQETKALTGLDLYQQGIQPIWLEVENLGGSRIRVAPWSIDRHYFSPIEVAYMNRKKFSSNGYQDMERWFHSNAMQRHIQPGETSSGLVYTNLTPGTKGFNLDVFAETKAYTLTFFIPLPGFTADYSRVDFAGLYPAEQFLELNEEALLRDLETELPCCATDETGDLEGAPLNVVLVGSGLAVRRSMLRGGWLETAAGDPKTTRARTQYFRNRTPDTTFYKPRDDNSVRVELRLWLAPCRVDEVPVWVGQVVYAISESWLESRVHAELLPQFLKNSVVADIDGAKRLLFQNLWYNHSILRAGYARGAGESTVDKPAVTFDGIEYFTNGYRLVTFLSEESVALDEAVIIYLKPIGQASADEK
jgi:hypothetical protein